MTTALDILEASLQSALTIAQARATDAPVLDTAFMVEGAKAVLVAEQDGFVIAVGQDEIDLVEARKYAKALSNGWWIERASEWYMDEEATGLVVGFGSGVVEDVATLEDAYTYLAQQESQFTEAAADAEGEVILEALTGVAPVLPKRNNTKIALFLCALSNGATEAELQEIIGPANKASVRQFIYYVCRTSAKAYGCRLVGDKYQLITPA